MTPRLTWYQKCFGILSGCLCALGIYGIGEVIWYEGWANAAFGVTASPVLRTEPVPVSAVPAGTDFRKGSR